MNDNEIEELEAGLVIDENDLDNEIASQSESYYRVAKELALATSQRDAAKQFLTETESRVDIDIRNNAEGRQTESMVTSMKMLDPDVIAARTSLNDLSRTVGILQALERAFDKRSFALGKLSDLYVAGYFGANINSRAQGDVRDVQANRARAEMDKMRRANHRRPA